jgi:hypothetical protein
VSKREVDKENDPVKTYELNEKTKKTFWTASIATLLGVGILAGAVESSGEKIASSLGISGVILGFISLLLAIAARIVLTTARERRMKISLTMAKSGFWLSVFTMIVIVYALVFYIFTLIDCAFTYS